MNLSLVHHKSFIRRSRLLIALTLSCAACLGFSSTAAAKDFAPTAVVGKGHFSHRFILRDPITKLPMPYARYRLVLPDTHIPGFPDADSESVVSGKTDAQGHTAAVKLSKRHAESEWSLLPVVGKGEFGGSFDIEGAPGTSYVIDIANEYLFCGKSNAQGKSVYVESQQARGVDVHIVTAGLTPADYAWCQHDVALVSPLSESADPAELFRAIYASYLHSEKELSNELRHAVYRKLFGLALSAHDLASLELVLPNLDSSIDDFNGLAYDAINADFAVDHGLVMVDKYLLEHPEDPNALDTKGWALYRLHRPEEALPYFDRSKKAFESLGGEDNNAVRTEGLTHKGEVLWILGRHDEAKAVFEEAHRLDADNAVLEETLERLKVEM